MQRHTGIPADPTHEYYDAMHGPDTAEPEPEPGPFECDACRRVIAEEANVCISCARHLDGNLDDSDTAARVR